MRASSRAYSQLSKVKRILSLAAEVDSAGRQVRLHALADRVPGLNFALLQDSSQERVGV